MLRRRPVDQVARAILGDHPYALNRRDRLAILAEERRPAVVERVAELRASGVGSKGRFGAP